MAASLNNVTIVGRLGAAPDIKQGSSDSVFGTLSVATNRKFKNKEGKMTEETEWHKVAVYGQNAEFAAKFLQTGDQVIVTGRLRTRSYEDKDGAKKYVTEINASNLQGLGSGSVE